jgi:uncharacterized integral membrane protein
MTDESTDRSTEAPATKEVREAPEKSRARFRWGLSGLALVIAAVAFLAYQNIGDVPVRAFWWEFSIPLVVVIVATSIVTLVIQRLVSLVARWRRRRWRLDLKRAVRNRRRRR